jgi:hypothetical protein
MSMRVPAADHKITPQQLRKLKSGFSTSFSSKASVRVNFTDGTERNVAMCAQNEVKIDHSVSMFGTFKDEGVQEAFASVLYDKRRLKRVRFWCVVVGAIAALWALAGHSRVTNDDVAHGLLSIMPCAIVLVTALTIDPDNVDRWKRCQLLFLFAACLFAFGSAYDHYKQYETNTLLSRDTEWVYVDSLWVLFVVSSAISLLVVFIIAKNAFQLQLKELLILGPVVMVTQFIFTCATYMHRRDLGFDDRTEWLTTFMVANGGMVFAVLDMLREQRAYEAMTRAQVGQRTATDPFSRYPFSLLSLLSLFSCFSLPLSHAPFLCQFRSSS